MKLKLSLIISAVFVIVIGTECKFFNLKVLENRSKVIEALHQVVNKMSGRFAVIHIVTPENHKEFGLGDLKNEFMTKTDILLRHYQSAKYKNRSVDRQDRMTIMLVNDFNDFKNIFTNVGKFSGFYVIVLVIGEIEEVENIFQKMWKVHIYNVIIMFEGDKETILVKGFHPFTHNSCNDTTPVLISTIRNGSFTSGIENIFHERMENLHKCPIRVALSDNARPEVFI